jgi:hypothetical protein
MLEVDGGRWAEGEGRRQDPELWARLEKMFLEADPGWRPVLSGEGAQDAPRATQYATRIPDLSAIKGLVWRGDGQIRVNADRPYICDLDDLPLPRRPAADIGVDHPRAAPDRDRRAARRGALHQTCQLWLWGAVRWRRMLAELRLVGDGAATHMYATCSR